MTSALRDVVRATSGRPAGAATTALALARELLGAEGAVLVGLLGHDWQRLAAVGEVSSWDDDRHPLGTGWVFEVVRRGGLLVGDPAEEPALAAHPETAVHGIGALAGAVVRSGSQVVGALVVVSRLPQPTWNARDASTLVGIASALEPVVVAALGGGRAAVPAPRRHPDLESVAASLAGATGVEQLSRPLLNALHDLTGLASTYLTSISVDDDEQHIRVAHNTRDGFALPEGLVVPWGDTLCKRALDEGQPCTVDVPDVWGDSGAARALGIQTYVSVPVVLADGQVWGTLCGADPERRADAEVHLPVMRLFARLVAAEVERTAALARARREADTDALTGLATRRVVLPWIVQAQQDLQPDEVVTVLFIDIDRFKQVNDTQGHATGDQLIVEVARRLVALARVGDLTARIGGDEFVLAARLPVRRAQPLVDSVRAALAFGSGALAVRCSVGVATDAAGGAPRAATDLLAAADAAMYDDKAIGRDLTA